MWVQNGLEELHRQQFPSILRREEDTRKCLMDAQQQAALDPTNQELKEHVKVLREQVVFLGMKAISYMSQKAKEDWMLKWGHNTAYFHVVMQRKAYRNNIYSIHDSQGQLIRDQEGVAECLREHYV